MSKPHFNGPDYDPELDHDRLSNQIDRVRDLMLDGRWRTIRRIAALTRDPEASVSAQLRHLRKKRFGGYTVEKRRVNDPKSGLFEYRVLPPDKGCRPESKTPRAELIDMLVRAKPLLGDTGDCVQLVDDINRALRREK